MEEDPKKKQDYVEPTIFFLILLGIYFTSFYSYLLFHTIAEFFSIVIAGGIFVIGWNSRRNIDNSFFLVVGISFLFVGFIDIIHTLSYTGMNIFKGYDTNLPAQLWIAARYLQAFSFLFASLVVNKKLKPYFLTSGYLLVTSILMFLIFAGIFPDCYIEGSGLTLFKIVSEYIINLILFITIFILYIYRSEFDEKILILIISSILATIIAEFAFTFYVSAYGFSNLVGHIFKIIAFYLLYKSIISIGLETPFDLVYRKLKISEQRITDAYSELDQMFNAALPIRIIDNKFNMIKVNDTFCKLFKFKREELIGKKCFEILPYEFCHTDACTRNQILSGKEKITSEILLHQADGTEITLIVDSIPYRGHKGEFLGLIQNYTDITDRKKAEELIEQSEEKYKQLYEHAPNAYFSIGTDKSLLKWNEAAEKLLGYSKEEFSKMQVTELYANTENGKVKAKEVFNRFLQGETIRDEELQMKHKNGKHIWISLSVRPVFDQRGNVKESRSMVIDISERKKAEEVIKNLARFPSESPYPVLRVNKNGIIYSNKAGENIFNIAINDKIPPILRDDVEKALSEKVLTTVEKEVDSKTYSFVITPVEGVSYVNIYGTDITERKKAERRLEQLISTVSHELRTPITVILMSLDYLKNQKEILTPDLERKLMDGISRNTSLLHQLAEDILMVSRIDEKKIELEWSDYTPSEIINEILILLEPKYKEKNVTVNVDIDDDICLKGDSKRIDHVFRIIIDNAIKYSNEHSKIDIKAIDNYKGEYNKEEKSGVLLQFKDTGIGIPRKDLPFIFDRFFRSDQVRDISGTGLGLSIAKDLVELHKGDIFMESEVGKGSTISIFLPKPEALF